MPVLKLYSFLNVLVRFLNISVYVQIEVIWICVYLGIVFTCHDQVGTRSISKQGMLIHQPSEHCSTFSKSGKYAVISSMRSCILGKLFPQRLHCCTECVPTSSQAAVHDPQVRRVFSEVRATCDRYFWSLSRHLPFRSVETRVLALVISCSNAGVLLADPKSSSRSRFQHVCICIYLVKALC